MLLHDFHFNCCPFKLVFLFPPMLFFSWLLKKSQKSKSTWSIIILHLRLKVPTEDWTLKTEALLAAATWKGIRRSTLVCYLRMMSNCEQIVRASKRSKRLMQLLSLLLAFWAVSSRAFAWLAQIHCQWVDLLEADVVEEANKWRSLKRCTSDDHQLVH